MPRPKRTPLSPVRKLILSAWVLVVFCLFFYLFRGMPGRALMPILLLATLIFGLLLGLKWIAAYDQATSKPKSPRPDRGPNEASPSEPPADQFETFMTFLKQKRAEAQFSTGELKAWCEAHNMNFDNILRAAISKKWIRDFNGKMAITSLGERLIESYLSRK